METFPHRSGIGRYSGRRRMRPLILKLSGRPRVPWSFGFAPTEFPQIRRLRLHFHPAPLLIPCPRNVSDAARLHVVPHDLPLFQFAKRRPLNQPPRSVGRPGAKRRQLRRAKRNSGTLRDMAESVKIVNGGMAERLNAAVLKTVSGETRSGVRIPLPPPISNCPDRTHR